jgi:hypothetical protein
VANAPISLALAALLGLLMHWWPRLPGHWRRRLSVLTNVAGLAFLVAAVRAEGLRETATTSVVILGPAYHTATASASASLYYYVLTAACLLLGFAGLAFGETLSATLSRHYVASAVLVGWLLTVVRFLLEKSAAPPELAQSVGVTLVAPIAGAWLATCLRDEAGGWRDLLRRLAAYAFLVRGFVALLGIAATRLGWGTHYDVSNLTSVVPAATSQPWTFEPGSLHQVFWLVLVPQMLAWPLYTIAAGLAGGALAWRLPGRPGPRRTMPATSAATD